MSKWVHNPELWVTEEEVLEHLQDMTIIRCSQLFWWIAYLRLSSDYWWCCHEHGDCQDEKLQNVFEHFGNLYEFECLDDWWAIYATKVFGKTCDDSVTNFDMPELISKLNEVRAGFCSQIPWALSRQHIHSLVDEMLDQIGYEKISRDFPHRFSLSYFPTKSRRRILSAYQTWCLTKLIDQSGHKAWGQYEIGSALNLSPRNRGYDRDSLAILRNKQKAVRATTQQNLADANLLIANVEVGCFPVKKATDRRIRWSTQQMKRLNEAMQAGLRFGKNWLSNEFRFLDPHQKRLLPTDNQENPTESASILLDYGKMNFPFMESQKQARTTKYQAKIAVKVGS